MALGRALQAVLVVAAVLALAACGEKEENITSADTTATETTQTVAAKLDPEVAEQHAREAASAALPKSFTVRPADWSVTCSGGESGGAWTCTVKGGPCSGKVIVSPPSGADANAITTDAKGVGCRAD
jgi:predicted small lipoprotein YifL